MKYHKTILLLCIITFLSLANVKKFEPNSLELIPNFDKIVHFLMYFSVSYILLFEHYIYNKHIKPGIRLLLLPFFWGGAMEILQYTLTTYRGADWKDLLANSVGIGISYFVFLLLKDYKWMNKIIVYPFKQPS